MGQAMVKGYFNADKPIPPYPILWSFSEKRCDSAWGFRVLRVAYLQTKAPLVSGLKTQITWSSPSWTSFQSFWPSWSFLDSTWSGAIGTIGTIGKKVGGFQPKKPWGLKSIEGWWTPLTNDLTWLTSGLKVGYQTTHIAVDQNWSLSHCLHSNNFKYVNFLGELPLSQSQRNLQLATDSDWILQLE